MLWKFMALAAATLVSLPVSAFPATTLPLTAAVERPPAAAESSDGVTATSSSTGSTPTRTAAIHRADRAHRLRGDGGHVVLLLRRGHRHRPGRARHRPPRIRSRDDLNQYFCSSKRQRYTADEWRLRDDHGETPRARAEEPAKAGRAQGDHTYGVVVVTACSPRRVRIGALSAEAST